MVKAWLIQQFFFFCCRLERHVVTNGKRYPLRFARYYLCLLLEQSFSLFFKSAPTDTIARGTVSAQNCLPSHSFVQTLKLHHKHLLNTELAAGKEAGIKCLY